MVEETKQALLNMNEFETRFMSSLIPLLGFSIYNGSYTSNKKSHKKHAYSARNTEMLVEISEKESRFIDVFENRELSKPVALSGFFGLFELIPKKKTPSFKNGFFCVK